MTLWALRPRWPRGDFEDAMANSRTLVIGPVIGPAPPPDMQQDWLLSDTTFRSSARSAGLLTRSCEKWRTGEGDKFEKNGSSRLTRG